MLWVLSLIFLCFTEAKLDVIVAGLGRTGTTSLKLALEQLGFGETHHMSEVFRSLGGGFEHIDAWIEAMNTTQERRIAILEKVFSNPNYRSVADQPGALFYKELSVLYPDAKIILTERDTPEAWFKSIKNSIGQYTIAATTEGLWKNPGIWLLVHLNPVFARINRLLWAMPVPHTLDQDAYVAFYKNWSAEVREYFKNQPGKLLIFNSKQGWEPLCKFLNVPVPSTPYPKVGESLHMQIMIVILNVVGVLHVAIPLWLCRWCYRKIAAVCTKKNKAA